MERDPEGLDLGESMTVLKPFQKATVKTVVNAFRYRDGSRRFLVADEVGLGKTVVAQHVIKEMMRRKRGALDVFYVCSNLSIASQNQKKLLEFLDNEDERQAALCSVDRLTLLPASNLPTHPGLHLYSFTPDTYIPLR